jgi:protein-tyrosine phosphatase
MEPFSEVFPAVFVGRTPKTTAQLPPGTRIVVLCAKELQKFADPTVRVIRCPLEDSERPLTKAEIKDVRKAVGAVKYAIHYRRRVLVACAEGINRSALIAALAIRQYTGFGPNVVLAMLREKRNWRCLSNPVFADMVRATLAMQIPK